MKSILNTRRPIAKTSGTGSLGVTCGREKKALQSDSSLCSEKTELKVTLIKDEGGRQEGNPAGSTDS